MKTTNTDKIITSFEEYQRVYFPDATIKNMNNKKMNPVQLGNDIATRSIDNLKNNLTSKKSS